MKWGQEALFGAYVLVCVPTGKLTNPLSQNQMPSSTVLIGHYSCAVSTLVWCIKLVAGLGQYHATEYINEQRAYRVITGHAEPVPWPCFACWCRCYLLC